MMNSPLSDLVRYSLHGPWRPILELIHNHIIINCLWVIAYTAELLVVLMCTHSPIYDNVERGSVNVMIRLSLCLRVCRPMYVMKSARCAVAAPLAHNFRSWLV